MRLTEILGAPTFGVEPKIWLNKYDKYPVNQFAKMYTALFADSQLKILYHTAEQLKMLDENKNIIDDSQIKWRHRTRNLLTLNNGNKKITLLQKPSSPANTADSLAGHQWYGAGYNISSNKKGCFSYTKDNQIYRFDISLFDLQ